MHNWCGCGDCVFGCKLQAPTRTACVLLQIDLDALRELSWSGIPQELRPTCWKLLLGYLPPNK